MTLRQAGPEDLDEVMVVERACFGDHDAGSRRAWSRAAWQAELGRAGSGNSPVARLVLLDREHGRTRAVADFGRVIDSCDLDRIMVVPGARRTGLAGDLLNRGMTWAADCGAETILLEVDPHNTAAVRLYRRHGFDEISRRENYYGSGRDALVMAAPLSGAGASGAAGAVVAATTDASNEERHV